MAQTHLVFSYGTLKCGEPNFHIMSSPETGSYRFVGIGETVKRYPLVVGSQYSVPFLLLVEGKGENVLGHIFEVNDEKLAALDELEAHPDLYIRLKTEIAMTHDEHKNPIEPPEIRECWVYFLPRFKPEMLELPYYRNYTSVSDDHPPYVESEDLCSVDQIE
ncbi:unnamed protein product [Candidula unifasciata]|uniref:Gamma-glutamylcyclotransferase family protein n=1 Tax=Candidula unifasciata TaxID=100452 RepID=A0A8S4A076_9EUPU|nr:unnamed protein product [Candidula unifasciata]